MAQHARDGSSSTTDNAIFVSESDSSDDDGNLAYAASAIRRTSYTYDYKPLETPPASKRVKTGTNELQHLSKIEFGASRSDTISATTNRRELSHVVLKQIDHSISSHEINHGESVLIGHMDRAQAEQRRARSAAETAAERCEGVTQNRNERKQKELRRSGLDTSYKPNADQDTNMVDEDWFKPEDLRAAQPEQNSPQSPARADKSERLSERKAEAKRKQESRERAFRKAQRGRAIPIVKSNRAPRRASHPQSSRKVEKFEPPVDFGSPSESDGEESNETEWDVEAIRDHATVDGELKYEVKWTGYDTDENTWEPEENLRNAFIILERYKENNMRSLEAPTAPMMS